MINIFIIIFTLLITVNYLKILAYIKNHSYKCMDILFASIILSLRVRLGAVRIGNIFEMSCPSKMLNS